LATIKDTLDQVVTNLAQTKTKPEEPDTPEMQAARQQIQNWKIDRARRMAGKPEELGLQQANQELQQTQAAPPSPGQRRASTQQQAAHVAAQTVAPPPPAQQSPQQVVQQAVQGARQLSPVQPKTAQRTTPPTPPLNKPGEEDVIDSLGESIAYWCPMQRRYVVEALEGVF
jgi:hypothetical protein